VNHKSLVLPAVVVASTLSLVGCGGGGGGGTVPAAPAAPEEATNYQAQTLKVFSDDAGIAKIVDPDTGLKAYFLGPEAAGFVAEINANDGNADDIIQSSFPITNSSLPHADIRSGTISSGGVTSNVTVFEDRTAEAAVFYVDIPAASANFALSLGSELTSIPAGTFNYVGTFGIANRSSGTQDVGTFNLTADFDNGLVTSYTGTTSNTYTTNLSGTNLPMNTSTGEFSASNLTLTVGGYSGTATLYGAFSDDAAAGVHGVYASNEADPTYGGAFAGHKIP